MAPNMIMKSYIILYVRPEHFHTCVCNIDWRNLFLDSFNLIFLKRTEF